MRTLLCGLVCSITLLGQDARNLEVVGKVKAEAFDRSEVMDTLSYISDVYGPRLTASPEFNQAAQ